MKTAWFAGVAIGILGCSAACSPGDEVPPELITEVGCITSAGDEFILTDLESASNEALETRPTTEAYRLIGADEQLRRQLEAQVGKRVQVSGSAATAQVAQIRILRPMVRAQAPQPPSAGTDTPAGEISRTLNEPRVEVGEQIRLETADLRVRSISPTGEACAPRQAAAEQP